MSSRAHRALAAVLVFASSPALCGTANVTLHEAATTSAGVFDSSGALVRTLWSGVPHPPGKLAVEWDGVTDDSEPAKQAERYKARVITHHVRYVWEGVIGNTSDEPFGDTIHRGFNPIHDMAMDDAGNAFYVVGYNEAQNAIHRFRTSRPQRRTPLAHDDFKRVFRYAATDGSLAYFANIGLPGKKGSEFHEPASFVIALRVSDGREHKFAAGVVEMPERPGNRWESVIDRDRTDVITGGRFRNAPTGLAVQQRGDYLFVAHGGLDEIRVFDKRSGALVDRIATTSPGDMDVAPDDSLWVLVANNGRAAVARYRKQGTQWVRETLVTEGLVDAVALGVSPVDGTLVVVDAGSEQLKAFEPSGKPAWTFGRAGGYAKGGPQVTEDKFWFSSGPAWLAFQKDGSFWTGDPGNLRNLHFSTERRYVEQIMYMPHIYSVAVDPADPRRVFSRFLEFSVDYSRPLKKSWKLVRNWGAGLAYSETYKGTYAGLRSVHTLTNGLTYGAIPRLDGKVSDVVALAPDGLRQTGMRLDVGTKLYPDGSLRFHAIRGRTLQLYSRKIEGFDGDGIPHWGEPESLGGVSGLKDGDPWYHDVPLIPSINGATYPTTGSDVIVSYNPGKSEGFHLGGIRRGDNRWLWRANPSGSWQLDSQGNIVTLNGTYELGRGVHYPGNIVTTAGRHIVAGYHGEYWNGGQAGQFFHFLDDGLFVGQFGKAAYPGNNRTYAQPQSAGNAFCPQLVAADGQIYLWHNDESVHGGVHRWRLDGADDIKVLEAAIEP